MRFAPALAAFAGLAALAACDVDRTEEGELPEVDVNATGGDLPEYDVQTEDVDVTTEERTVEVPVVETEENPEG